MPPPFSATCMSVGTLLGGEHRYSVPGYQRAYAWTTDQASQLLDDLLSAMDGVGTPASDTPDDYFLGAIVLMHADGGPAVHREPPPGSRRADVVDGLQRLVTLTILLAVLRDIAEDEDPASAARAASCILAGPDAAPRLLLAETEAAFFEDYVQSPRATSAMPTEDELSPAASRILAVREHLLDVLVGEPPERRDELMAYLLERCHVALISAHTIDRAHQVFSILNDRGMPLTRSDILKAQLLGAVAPGRRVSALAAWNDIEQRLGGSLEELFAQVRTLARRGRGRIIDDIRALVAEVGDPAVFIEEVLDPHARVLAAIRDASLEGGAPSPTIAAQLRYLGWLGSQDWIAPAMLFWQRVHGDPGRLEQFLARLDRLAYGLRLLGVGSDKRAARYRALIDAITEDTLDEPQSPIELSRDEQRLILYNLRALHGRSQLACKLVLLRLNDLLAGAPQGLDPAGFTVEHVLPQKPARNSQWREWFPSPEERERWTDSLGNLVLVSREGNEQARNLDLAHKLSIYFAGSTAQPHLTRDIEGLGEWRPEDVSRREDRLLGLLVDIWRLGPPRIPGEPETVSQTRARRRQRASDPV